MHSVHSWSIAAAHLLSPQVTKVRAIMDYSGTSAGAPLASYNPPALTSGVRLDYTMLESADEAYRSTEAPGDG